ncbi:hypothetical protein [Haloarcula onubensis]|uniref:HTH marR-type domain-containing protein n=1 Tax=Haloarcula onubensis TaxID=2950539 RepID=A0ABU2FVE4_9EURY|nr:hypothetical protein [Halomicroarcula sp. S3CR25-11]MDS0284742.1 hypothetical protein [Halomicroarcula sp. S3CR25-11]
MPEAGLRPTEQAPVDAVAHVDAGDLAPSELWHEIATTNGFQDQLVDAVREVLAGTCGRREWPGAMRETGITARDGRYAQLVAWLDRPAEHDYHQDALNYTASLGRGTVTVYGTRCTLEEALAGDLADGPLTVLEAANVTPTVAVRLGPAFRERKRAQREDALELLGVLAHVFDVAVVTTGLTARWLVEDHGQYLPSEFTEHVSAGRGGPLPADVDVEAVTTALTADSREVHTLRLLAAEPNERQSQAALVATQSVGKAAVSQALSVLEECNLVERFDVGREKHAQLTPAGSAVLDRLDAEHGRQAELDALFSETGNPSHRTCNPARQDPRPDVPSTAPPADDSTGTAYRTRWLGRGGHAAAGAVATNGGVTAAEGVLPTADGAEKRHTRYVSYDADRDEAVVAVRATSPLQYIVSTALAFSSPRLLEKALPASRLEDVDLSAGLLRDARCIGALSDDAVGCGEQLHKQLTEWGERLEDMTRQWRQDEVEDRDAFAGELLRSAHGLAGTMVHLLDVAGVNVVRELRVPSTLGHGQLEDLAETITTAVSIQARYGHYAVYRQLFESRDGKRQAALSPDVDAEDPVGQYIGGLVLRGPSSHRLARHVQGQLRSARSVQEDAPEIAVDVPVGTPGREAYTEAVNRMARPRGITATPEAVTMFRALTGDPYAVADAVHWLGSEDEPRKMRLDEVRVSLAALEADRLLPDAPPTLSKAVAALLRSSQPLTQTALAEEAGVSTRSLRTHLDALVALDIVQDTDDGLRLTLPFADDEERGQHILPAAVDERHTAVQDLLFDAVATLVEDDRLGDPGDPVGAAFCWPPDIDSLQTHLPDVNPYLRIARTLCHEADPPATTVQFGAPLQQTSLQASAAGGVPT